MRGVSITQATGKALHEESNLTAALPCCYSLLRREISSNRHRGSQLKMKRKSSASARVPNEVSERLEGQTVTSATSPNNQSLVLSSSLLSSVFRRARVDS